MKQIKLKYGCNNNQNPAKLYLSTNENLPLNILNGNPSYINFLDALNGWQLVSELKHATNVPAAASFKHFSPSGAAIGTPISNEIKKILLIDDLNITSEIAIAYAKARGCDRMCSYGDWVALSDECDEQTATILKREVSDGIIAPSFSESALSILKKKKQGNYNIIQIDKNYKPNSIERRELFGITLEQKRNDVKIDDSIFKNIVTKNKKLTTQTLINLKIANIALKYTQSNSICFAYNNMTIGIGAGQQSRIDCIKLAGQKANSFLLRRHPKILNLPFLKNLKRTTKDNLINSIVKNEFKELLSQNWRQFFTEKPILPTELEIKEWLNKTDGICLASDGFFPFSDNVKMAAKFNVKFISQPGGSIRDNETIKECNLQNIVMVLTSTRLFFH